MSKEHSQFATSRTAQVKFRGIYWRIWFASWSEFHQPHSERWLRRAWWWLYHWPKYGKYCLRICGLTLHGRRNRWRWS